PLPGADEREHADDPVGGLRDEGRQASGALVLQPRRDVGAGGLWILARNDAAAGVLGVVVRLLQGEREERLGVLLRRRADAHARERGEVARASCLGGEDDIRGATAGGPPPNPLGLIDRNLDAEPV